MTKKISEIKRVDDGKIKVSVDYGEKYNKTNVDFVSAKKDIDSLFEDIDDNISMTYTCVIDYNYPMWENYSKMAHLAIGSDSDPKCNSCDNDTVIARFEEDSKEDIKQTISENPETILCNQCFSISESITEF